MSKVDLFLLQMLWQYRFYLINIESSTDGYNVPLSSLRYWKKNVHKTKYFNDFICFSLRQHTKKRVLINADRKSLSRFLCINLFNLKVFYEHRELVNWPSNLLTFTQVTVILAIIVTIPKLIKIGPAIIY